MKTVSCCPTEGFNSWEDYGPGSASSPEDSGLGSARALGGLGSMIRSSAAAQHHDDLMLNPGH